MKASHEQFLYLETYRQTSSTFLLAINGYRYYCRVTDANRETINSETVNLTVVAAPQTGDSSHPEWMIVFALLAVLGMNLIRVRKRRKTYL